MEKIKKVFVSMFIILSTNWLLGLIILSGLLLRLIGLNKPDGLWFDELHSYSTAITLFSKGWNGFIENIENFFYFATLGVWIKIFGSHDTVLRLFSIFFGLASIPVVYFAAKKLDSHKAGLIAAMLVSISSFCIYYSQEVRYYSFIMFLCAISCLYLIKMIEEPEKSSNIAGFCIINFLIVISFPIGFLFVALEILLLFAFCKNKFSLIPLLKGILICFILLIPYLIIILKKNLGSQYFSTYTPEVASLVWKFSYDSIFSLVYNWFTPSLLNLFHTPSGFFQNFFSGFLTNPLRLIPFCLFNLIPLIIFIYAVFSGFKKNINLFLLGILVISFVMIQILLAMSGKFILSSRYTILIYPLIIIISAVGLSKKKFVNGFCIYYLLIANLFYLIISPVSSPKIQRAESFATVAKILDKYDLTSDDMVFMPYGGRFLYKYYDKARVTDFNMYNIICGGMKGVEFLKEIFISNNDAKVTNLNILRNLRPYLLYDREIKPYSDFLEEKAFKTLQKGRYFVFVVTEGVSQYTPQTLKIAASNEKFYVNQPSYYILSSKITAETIKAAKKYLSLEKLEKSGVWKVYLFKNSAVLQ